MPGGVIVSKATICRIVHGTKPGEPLCWTESLQLDGATAADRTWTKDLKQGWEFDSHALADKRAGEIRKQTGKHVHAAILEKPMSHKPVLDPLTEVKIPKITMDPFRAAQCRRDAVLDQ
jgi:hypothetical protein